MTVDELEQKLNRPLYVLKMARRDTEFDTPMSRSCKKRADNARKEIHELIVEYAADHFYDVEAKLRVS